ncbi:MAG: hypothetical protein JSV76_02975 [Candidatus Bathyarchaeota archaeon]|nr:MAG: hypothetical protein JSV76_02975 [Candidatus Bathyarchaeota archaeon]
MPTENVKKLNLYAKRLRQTHCETLMGIGVVIVEGDSDKWWLHGVSRILNGEIYNDKLQEAFELLGIAIVSAETEGDIIKLGEFFDEAGIKVIGVFDCPNDPSGLAEKLKNCSFPSICLKEKGLENILAYQLPINILREYLIESPHSKSAPIYPNKVNNLSDPEVREESRNRLIQNKGSAAMHEWLISKLDPATLPVQFKSIVDMVSCYIKGELELNSCSLLN